MRGFTGLSIVAALWAIGSAADAHRVAPMTYELSPSGTGASTVLRLENTNQAPITIEVVVERRAWDVDGNETRTPAEDDFVVLPPQMVVQPGRTQAIRVQYVGAPVVDDTAMYVVSLNQVPVKDPNAPTGVQFVINFGTAAYVVPPNARSDLHVVSVAPSDQPGQVKVMLENRGARHAPLGDTTWTFVNAKGERMELSGDPLRETLVAPVVPSHGRRAFLVKAKEGFDTSSAIELTIR